MLHQKSFKIEIPTQVFLHNYVHNISVIDELEARYPELKEWLTYALTYEIEVDQIHIRLLKDHDMIALIHGVNWYMINILQGINLRLRFERYNTVWGTIEDGIDDEYSYEAFEQFLEIIKTTDPTIDKKWNK